MTGYDVARKYLRLHENKDTKILNDFISKRVPAWKGLSVSSTPWCAGFVGACEVEVGNKGTGKLNARSYLTYGEAVTLKTAKKGDIVVFTRGGSTWQGHVAFYDGLETDSRGRILIRTIGGNQSDSVSVGWYPKDRLLAIRRPPSNE